MLWQSCVLTATKKCAELALANMAGYSGWVRLVTMAYGRAAIAIGVSPCSVGLNHLAEAQALINAGRVALL